MDIQLKKLELIEWIISFADDTLINQMYKYKNTYDPTTNGIEVKPMTVEEFLSSIERAEQDIRDGKVYSQSQVEKDSENW